MYRRRATILALFVSLGGTAFAACSTSTANQSFDAAPPRCNVHPFDCPAGQTCWPDSDGTFSCYPSADAGPDAACELLPGNPTCGDGQFCFLNGIGPTCYPYCDPSMEARGCPSGLACDNGIELAAGVMTSVCLPNWYVNGCGTEPFDACVSGN